MSEHISYHAISGNVKVGGRVILDPHLDSDQCQNLITYRGSPVSLTVFVQSPRSRLCCICLSKFVSITLYYITPLGHEYMFG